jgi:predicted dienelactone hydrolase
VRTAILLVLLLALGGVALATPPYDPLAVRGTPPAVVNRTVTDRARHRVLPVRVYLPASSGAAPVIVFSHGLGGSVSTCAYLGEHWAGHGYVAVFVQHPGSDEGVWKDVPVRKRMSAMREAASLQNLKLRVEDIRATLDQLARWNRTAGDPLHGRLDMARVGMSGHSFGALTTQFLGGELGLRDPRIKACVIMSPSAPRASGASRAFRSVAIPWLLMTGTRDVAKIGHADLASRLAVYPALPPGGKYELVLFDAEHSAFTDRALPGDSAPRNPNHHRAILAISTAFWDAWLRGDASAKQWLDGAGPRSVIEPKDRWQHK